MFRRSSVARQHQADEVKRTLLSESFLKVEEAIARKLEAMKLNRAQRRAGIRLVREGGFPKQRGWADIIRQFLPPPGVLGADGIFYHDTREPHIVTDVTAVTMAATAKAIYPAAAFPVLGGGYFGRPGKAIKICIWFKIVVAGTPGNFSFNVHWGTGADANGTLICVAGTPVALTGSVTKCGYAEFTIRCLTTGTAGTLQATGWAVVDPALIAATLNPILIPTAGAAASAALDLTAANIVSVQALQSGTAGTIQTQELKVIALN